MPNSQPLQNSIDEVEVLKQENIYDGHIHLIKYHLRHQLFSGGWSHTIIRELLINRQAVGVLLYDPQRDEVVLIEQFRIGAFAPGSKPWLLEIVAGLIDGNENPESVAKRETLEEANCIIQDLIPITEYWVTPGISAEKVKLFCGHVDSSNAGGIYGLADEGEDIRVRVLSRKNAYNAVISGEINNSISIIALQWLELNYSTVQQSWSVAR